MNRELNLYKDQIPGLITNTPDSPNGPLQMTIEELDLSVRSYNCLKRAGLHTIGDIIAYGDLSTIRNITRRCIEEIQDRVDSAW